MIWLCGWDQASIEAWSAENPTAGRSGDNYVELQNLQDENEDDIHD